ncbi:MAG: porin [Ignavibacteria bacterium]
MQKKLIALAIAGLSGAAFAQSNVTVYGVADMYVANVTAAGHSSQTAINSGGLSGSRLGFKGTEALGNGTSALFVLEYALALDANSGVGGPDQSSNQARQQIVGLTGSWGTAVAGFAQTAGYDFSCQTNPVAGSQLDASAKLGTSGLLACGAAGRAGNAVAYISPSFGGFTVALNHARITETNKYVNGANDATGNLLGFKYANGPIGANLTWAKISNIRAATGGGAGTVDEQTEWGLTGSYDFGVAKAFASYQTLKQDIWNERDSKWQLSAAVPLGGGNFIAQYAQNNVKHTAATDNSKAYTLAYAYGLSKRTTLYTGYTHVSNDSGATKGAFADVAAASAVSGATTYNANVTPTAGGNASVFAVGINHAF